MCTLEEIVGLEMEIVDTKQLEELLDHKPGRTGSPVLGEGEGGSKTPYSDITQVRYYTLAQRS